MLRKMCYFFPIQQTSKVLGSLGHGLNSVQLAQKNFWIFKICAENL